MAPALTGLGAGLLVPSVLGAAGGIAGDKLLSGHTPEVSPEALSAGKAFSALSQDTQSSPQELVRKYVEAGHSLASKPAVTTADGKQLTGRDLIYRIRTGGLGKLLSAAGMGEWTPGSGRHYDEFAKGPVAALKQVGHETAHNLPAAMMGDVLGARYEAAQQSIRNGKIHPALFRSKLREVLGNKFNNAEHGARYADKLETAMLAADPVKYRAHLDTVAAGADGSALQTELLRTAVGPGALREGLDGRDAIGNRMARTYGQRPDSSRLRPDQLEGAAARASALRAVPESDQLRHLLDHDLVAGYTALKAAPNYRAAAGNYNRLVTTMDQYARARELAQTGSRGAGRLGIAGLIGSLGMLGTGIYGAMRGRR